MKTLLRNKYVLNSNACHLLQFLFFVRHYFQLIILVNNSAKKNLHCHNYFILTYLNLIPRFEKSTLSFFLTNQLGYLHLKQLVLANKYDSLTQICFAVKRRNPE